MRGRLGFYIKESYRSVQRRKADLRVWAGTFSLGRKALEIRAGLKGRALPRLSTEPPVRFVRHSLKEFAAANRRIEFPHSVSPEVSIIIFESKNTELTLNCLYSISQSSLSQYEVIICNNGDSELPLGQIKGAEIIESAGNLSVARAYNLAARQAKGKQLLFLNDTAVVLPDSISSALRAIKESDVIGAVGGKVISADNVLQEAGAIIWRDGTRTAYGKGDTPFAPMYMFRRKVDCCLGNLLLTRKDVFSERRGFDETLKSAWCQDYCVRLWKVGREVIYEPGALAVSFEHTNLEQRQRLSVDADSVESEEADLLTEKHKEWLKSRYPASQKSILFARAHTPRNKRILFIDDRVPHSFLGAGFPRSNLMLSEMVRLGYSVTFYPMNIHAETWENVYADIPDEAEVMLDYDSVKLPQFLRQREGYYDLIIVSRPSNMALAKSFLFGRRDRGGKPKVIYDMEALASLRDIERLRLDGEDPPRHFERRLCGKEMALTRGSSAVISVSEAERQRFTELGIEPTYILGHAVEPRRTDNPFHSREGILFVGPVGSSRSPNEDSITWFIEEIFPTIQMRLGREVSFMIAGTNRPDQVSRYSSKSIRFFGRVDDLEPLYNQARIFVAPTRFAAGIPLKIYDAASFGVPAVTTRLLEAQLGWRDEVELLTATDAAGFADQCVRLYSDERLWTRIRNSALKQIESQCAPESFSSSLEAIIEETLGSTR